VNRESLLVVRAQFGDIEAMDSLLRDVQEPLFRHILYIVGDADSAEDLLQDTLLTVSRKLGALRDPNWFRPWAFRIATRASFRAVRRERRRLFEDVSAIEVAVERAEPRFEPELVAMLPALLVDLPPSSGAVLKLYYMDSMTLHEVAEVLDIPVGTVKSRLSYGLKALRKLMPERGVAGRT
jgi:RNA polymerase sigma-70 factor (ECF subfamily)